MHALGMASDYLRWTATTSSFVVGMRQGQTNIFLLPSSERESDGKISQEKFTSKKKKRLFHQQDMNKILPQAS